MDFNVIQHCHVYWFELDSTNLVGDPSHHKRTQKQLTDTQTTKNWNEKLLIISRDLYLERDAVSIQHTLRKLAPRLEIIHQRDAVPRGT